MRGRTAGRLGCAGWLSLTALLVGCGGHDSTGSGRGGAGGETGGNNAAGASTTSGGSGTGGSSATGGNSDGGSGEAGSSSTGGAGGDPVGSITANDVNYGDIPEDETVTIELDYVAEGVTPVSCETSTAPADFIVTTCRCQSGTCTVSVEGTSESERAGEFEYRLSEDGVASNWATVSVVSQPVNDVPLLGNQQFDIPSSQMTLTETLDITDPDGPGLEIQISTEPSMGTVTFDDAARTFTYTKTTPTYFDSFSYRVSDGIEWSSSCWIQIESASERPVLGEALLTPGSYIVPSAHGVEHVVEYDGATYLADAFSSSDDDFSGYGFYVARLDADGNVAWGNVYETTRAFTTGSHTPSVLDLIVTEHGVLLHGESSSSFTVDGATYASGMPDGDYLMQFDFDGNLIWYNNFGTSSRLDTNSTVSSTAYDSNGNLYACGSLYGSYTDGTESWSTSYYDGICYAYDPLGDVIWVQALTSAFDDTASISSFDEVSGTMTVDGSYVGSVRSRFYETYEYRKSCGDLYCTDSYSAELDLTTGYPIDPG